jgi:exopolysaccharide production protein ExoQ
MTATSQIFTSTKDISTRALRIPTSAVAVCLCAILFFTMLDGFARFGRVPSYIWLITYAFACASFLHNPARTLRIILQNWPVFLIPMLALLSVIWTSAPTRTTLAATQFFMTLLIAVHIGSALNTRQLMLALFLGQAAGLCISLINMGVNFVPSINPINGTLIGIYGHKTALGYSAILSSFALTSYLAFDRREVWGILYAVGVSPIVFMSGSSTALAGYGTLVVLWTLLLLRRAPPIAARRILFALGLSLVALTLALLIKFTAIYTAFLNLFGKSTTLTGRTVLWDMAITSWQQTPFLGTGFGAFWHSTQQLLEVAFVHAYVDDRVDGFHNAFLESAVALGMVGFVLLMAMVLIPAIRLMRNVFVTFSLDAIIWLSLLVAYILVAMMFQDVGFKQHSGNYILMTLCYLFAKPRENSQN